MDDIKLFAKTEEKMEAGTNNKNIQSGYRNGIWHRIMCHARNENWKKTNNKRNRTTKSRKNQNASRKGKLQVLGNIRSGYHLWQYIRLYQNLRRLSFNLLTVPLSWLCHRMTWLIYLSAHIVFLIQTADQTLIRVPSRWVDGWDRTIKKVKKKLTPINKEQNTAL